MSGFVMLLGFVGVVVCSVTGVSLEWAAVGLFAAVGCGWWLHEQGL